jgi:hypothetical protein
VCSRTPGKSPRSEGVAAGLHHTSEGEAVTAIATTESHSARPLALAPWELEEVAREPAHFARDVA